MVKVKHTNDNYSVVPTKLNLNVNRLDPVVDQMNQTVNSLVLDSVRVPQQEQILITQDCKKTVSCLDVVTRVPTVILHGQPQRKGLSPGQYLNKIKFVKGVSCVSQYFSALFVPNVPHVAIELSVGGRLLASLVELGCESQSGVHFKRRLFSALLGKATIQQISVDCKQVHKPAQK